MKLSKKEILIIFVLALLMTYYQWLVLSIGIIRNDIVRECPPPPPNLIPMPDIAQGWPMISMVFCSMGGEGIVIYYSGLLGNLIFFIVLFYFGWVGLKFIIKKVKK